MSKQRTITFRANKALQEKVFEYCLKNNKTLAELIAEAVEEIYRKYNNENEEERCNNEEGEYV